MAKKQTITPSLRKWFIIGILLVIVIIPIVVIYPYTYHKNKVTPFSSTDYQSMSIDDFKDFNFSITCTEYYQTDSKKFSVNVDTPKENFTFTSVRYKVALGNKHWSGIYKEASSYTTIVSTFKSTNSTTSYTKKTNTITDFNYKYPKRTLLFIKQKNPDVFVLLNYTKTPSGSSNGEDVNILFTLKLKDVITSATI